MPSKNTNHKKRWHSLVWNTCQRMILQPWKSGKSWAMLQWDKASRKSEFLLFKKEKLSITKLLYGLRYSRTNFTHCSGVSIVGFEQVNAGCEGYLKTIQIFELLLAVPLVTTSKLAKLTILSAPRKIKIASQFKSFFHQTLVKNAQV